MSARIISFFDYDDHLIEHYERLSHLPGFVLLESSGSVHGRYDILSAHPYDHLKVNASSALKPEEITKLIKAKLPTVQKSELDLPFQGGAIGYFSYDFAVSKGSDSLPVYPASDMPWVDLRFYDWAIIVDHKNKTIVLVCQDFQDATKAILEEVAEQWGAPSKLRHKTKLQKPFCPLITKEAYQNAFDAIYQDLLAGRAYQVNYTQPFVAEYEGNAWDIYRKIRGLNPVPYGAFVKSDDGDVLSFSPERFLMAEKGKVLTSPIKGTTQRSSNPELDKQLSSQLLKSEKNRAENTMIVDLMRNDLGKLAKAGSVKVSALCKLESFSKVHHLVSDVEAQYTADVTPFDIFLACFPGGSITGTPKQEAMHIIREQEVYSRGVYCGSVGYWSSHGRMDTNIAIRTITAKTGTLYLPVGGAIVLDSKWEQEYKECFTKIAVITQACETLLF